MADESVDSKQNPRVTRRTFLGTTLAGGAALLAGGSDAIFGASSATMNPATNPTWQLGGDLPVNRLGFGAMRITGEGIWGWPPDRNNALKEMQDAGKIRHVGLSNVSPEEIVRARKVVPNVSVQNQYNIEDRKWEKTLVYCEKEDR